MKCGQGGGNRCGGGGVDAVDRICVKRSKLDRKTTEVKGDAQKY